MANIQISPIKQAVLDYVQPIAIANGHRGKGGGISLSYKKFLYNLINEGKSFDEIKIRFESSKFNKPYTPLISPEKKAALDYIRPLAKVNGHLDKTGYISCACINFIYALLDKGKSLDEIKVIFESSKFNQPYICKLPPTSPEKKAAFAYAKPIAKANGYFDTNGHMCVICRNFISKLIDEGKNLDEIKNIFEKSKFNKPRGDIRRKTPTSPEKKAVLDFIRPIAIANDHIEKSGSISDACRNFISKLIDEGKSFDEIKIIFESSKFNRPRGHLRKKTAMSPEELSVYNKLAISAISYGHRNKNGAHVSSAFRNWFVRQIQIGLSPEQIESNYYSSRYNTINPDVLKQQYYDNLEAFEEELISVLKSLNIDMYSWIADARHKLRDLCLVELQNISKQITAKTNSAFGEVFLEIMVKNMSDRIDPDQIEEGRLTETTVSA